MSDRDRTHSSQVPSSLPESSWRGFFRNVRVGVIWAGCLPPQGLQTNGSARRLGGRRRRPVSTTIGLERTVCLSFLQRSNPQSYLWLRRLYTTKGSGDLDRSDTLEFPVSLVFSWVLPDPTRPGTPPLCSNVGAFTDSNRGVLVYLRVLKKNKNLVLVSKLFLRQTTETSKLYPPLFG